MSDKLNPEVSVSIGGKSHQLRWDNAALFELGAFPDEQGELDTSNGPACWRRVCVYVWCSIVGDNPYKAPKDIALAVDKGEMAGVMDAINEAITKGTGGKDGTDDPLSVNGPTPE